MWHAWERKVYRDLVGKPEGKIPRRRQRRRCKDSIRRDLEEVGWGCKMDPVGSG
jgi:hypothetical protein